LAQEINAKS